MDERTLIEQITGLVMARLASSGEAEGAEAAASGGLQVPASLPATLYKGLVLLTEKKSQLEEYWEQMRACAHLPVEWQVFLSAEFSADEVKKELQPLRVQIYEALPPSWKTMIPRTDFVLVPVLPVTLASKIAHLIADDAASQVIIQSLIERRRILAGCEEISFLVRYSAQLPRALVLVMNTVFESVRAMGIEEIALNSLSREIQRFLGHESSPLRGSTVITRNDIEAALAEGKKTLEFLRGTIVTPLAREYAENMNVEIFIR
ncbi:MAG: hypothetical protein AB2L14_08310 [Candidatus Xenobiia bacterium LiM19]